GLLTRAGGVFFGILAGAALWRASAASTKTGMIRSSVRTILRLSAALVIFIVVLSVVDAIGERFTDEDDAVTIPADNGPDVTAPAFPGSEAALAPSSVAGREDSVAIDAAARMAQMEADNAELRSENAALRERIERFGFTDRVRSIATDDFGLGVGWFALYFTALVALFRGQTLGKWLVGVRVIRLDGRPMSWWIAFERFGGYAASLFTGLLGFLQILWDRNRQGIHDKVVETVVIRVLPGADHVGTRGVTAARVGGVRRT
ncbi:MAG: RDD family protein, partial [Longimicrobiales bacterium]